MLQRSRGTTKLLVFCLEGFVVYGIATEDTKGQCMMVTSVKLAVLNNRYKQEH